jgi:hypothetical protein
MVSGYDDGRRQTNAGNDVIIYESELNIVSFFRIALGINYRFTPDIALYDRIGNPVVSPDVMRGFSANLVLKFGKF